MPEVDIDDATAWDFFTLIDWWHLYGLPVLLGVVTIAVVVWSRSRRARPVWCDGSQTVLLVGLIHCALALQAWIALAQELRPLLVAGNPESHFSLVSAFIRSLVNPILAIGLMQGRPRARRFAIGWNAFLALLATLVVAWMWYYGVGINLAGWPEQVVPKIRPFFLVAVMFIPKIKQVFAAKPRAVPTNVGSSPVDIAPALSEPRACRWPALSVLALLLLIVECSNLVVGAADWGTRMWFASQPIS